MKNQPFLNDDNFFKSMELTDEGLLKARKLPIGTVSKGRKKIAEGKWVLVKDLKKESEKQKIKTLEKKQITKDLYDMVYGENQKRINDLDKYINSLSKKYPSEKNEFNKIKKEVEEWSSILSNIYEVNEEENPEEYDNLQYDLDNSYAKIQKMVKELK